MKSWIDFAMTLDLWKIILIWSIYSLFVYGIFLAITSLFISKHDK